MTNQYRRDKSWLLAHAKVIASELRLRREGTNLRIRQPSRSSETNTGGWSVVIGNLGKGQPRLEIWLDRFSGHPDRKLYACLYSESRRSLTDIIRRVANTLWPVREISYDDILDNEEDYISLVKPLRRHEFNTPILEKYENGRTYFGIYNPTRETSERINLHFCDRAVAFFEDVAQSIPSQTARDESSATYPRQENRQQVRTHIQRERSRLLAHDRKIRDNYTCQVCRMRFEDVYGRELGQNYAEAHHLIPLSQLKGVVKTSIEDLRTVCANCHRMLHRMNGEANDIDKLKKIVSRSGVQPSTRR